MIEQCEHLRKGDGICVECENVVRPFRRKLELSEPIIKLVRKFDKDHPVSSRDIWGFKDALAEYDREANGKHGN